MTRIIDAVFHCSLAIWLGASVARLVVGYDAFVAGTTTLKSWYTAGQQMHDIWLYTLLAGWTGWSFGVMALLGIIGLLLKRKQWKQHAWMVMVLIFLVLLLPAQAWLIAKDVELWSMFNAATGLPSTSVESVTSIFVHRMTGTEFSVVNGLVILMGLTMVGTLAMRPLTKND